MEETTTPFERLKQAVKAFRDAERVWNIARFSADEQERRNAAWGVEAARRAMDGAVVACFPGT